jgi:hypothetical protein
LIKRRYNRVVVNEVVAIGTVEYRYVLYKVDVNDERIGRAVPFYGKTVLL